jgi:phosphonate transport system substrate-binding protein
MGWGPGSVAGDAAVSLLRKADRMPLRRYGLVLATLAFTAVLSGGCDYGTRRIEIDLSDRISTDELQQLTHEEDPGLLRFSFDLRHTPVEDARQYLPLLRYLSKATGQKFELSFMPDSSTALQALGENKVQFAALGAGSYIIARERFGVVPVVRGIGETGRAEYRSVIIVPPDSPIHSVEELAGKRFAFGSKTSTQAHLIPRIVLLQHGIRLDALSAYGYTGSHHGCADAVLGSRSDAGGIQDTMGLELAKAGLVRVLHISGYYPSSGIVASPGVSSEVLATVKRALIAFDPQGRDAASLYDWHKTEMPGGFTESQDKDYENLRKWARRLGFLCEPEGGETP